MRSSARHRTRLTAIAACGVLLFTAISAGSAGSAAAAAPDDLELSDAQPVPTGSEESTKAPSSSLAQTPDELLGIASSASVPVIIKYDYDAVASYAGGVDGFDATSPAVTGEKLSEPSAAVDAYEAYVADQEAAISAEVEAAVSGVTFGTSLRTVYGGVVAYVPGNEIADLLAVPGVVAVQENTLNELLTDSSYEFINAPAAYDVLGTDTYAGAGVVYANLDSGVWPEHPSFAAGDGQPAYTGPPIPCEFGDNPVTPEPDVFECNDKLIGGHHFTDSYDEIAANGNATPDLYPGTARDGNGHGSHTASTSAGAVVENVQTLGPLVAHIQGVAPGAHVIEYKVCGPDGCTTADTSAAVQQAILDGADVINYSISGGTNPLTDATELAFLDAYNAGVFVAASAGNSGPTAGTANHLSPWVTTVAASTQTRDFSSSLTLVAGNGETFSTSGASITAGVDEPLPVVRASSFGDALCQEASPPPDRYVGVIVVCERGVNARVEKGYNVLQGGAAGMILYNPTLADVVTDNHWLPTVHVADGTDLVAFLDSHDGLTATFTDGAAGTALGDVIAAFSSRGPAGLFLKPDITAPGVQILAAHTPTPEDLVGGPAGQYYQAIAGTSMSSPHIAGVAILIKAVHPDWTPGQIKSAIMTQALTSVVKEDEVTPADPLDMGAGRVDVGTALAAPLTISDTAENLFALTGDPVHAIDVNIPSVNAPVLPGRITTSRTLENVTAGPLTVTPTASAPAGTTITFQPPTLTILAGGSGVVEITITTQASQGVQQFAAITFATNAGDARIPVAFVHTQGNVSLDQFCDATEIEVGATTTCTVTALNNSFDPQEVTITSSGTGAVSANVTQTATLAGAVLGVPSLGSGSTPAGFLPLSLFGIALRPVGDETILNFNVPPYQFNGQTYTAIGVTSNGYAVAGGGTAQDVEWDPPAGPSPAAPNNVLAPFWTDLNGEAAPGIRIGVLTDGVDSWLVVEWELAVWGTNDVRHFQAWIGVNATQDISYTYSAVQADPDQGYLVGAENAAGQGDMLQILPDDEYVITSTDPSPGDSLTLAVPVAGASVGEGVLHTELVAPLVPGVTTVDTAITVIAAPEPPLPPPWNPTAVYDTGDRVSYGGAVFVAQWWTQNQVPGASPWSAWAEVGAERACSSGTYLAWTASWIYTGGETVEHAGKLFTAKWWTRNQVPGDPWGPWQPIGSC